MSGHDPILADSAPADPTDLADDLVTWHAAVARSPAASSYGARAGPQWAGHGPGSTDRVTRMVSVGGRR